MRFCADTMRIDAYDMLNPTLVYTPYDTVLGAVIGKRFIGWRLPVENFMKTIDDGYDTDNIVLVETEAVEPLTTFGDDELIFTGDVVPLNKLIVCV